MEISERKGKILKKPKNIGQNLRADSNNYMDLDFVLKNTSSFDEFLIEQLKDPEEARAYLEVALEDYEQDADVNELLAAIKDVSEAQGGIEKIAKLGFGIRLERQKISSKQEAAVEKVQA